MSNGQTIVPRLDAIERELQGTQHSFVILAILLDVRTDFKPSKITKTDDFAMFCGLALHNEASLSTVSPVWRSEEGLYKYCTNIFPTFLGVYSELQRVDLSIG